MDSFGLIHFSVKKNERTYFFVSQPGASFAEVIEVLADFSVEFEQLKKEGEEKEAAKLAETEPIEAEIVSK